ncbi:MAG TPA: response regulator transcription factor [Bacteroidota bacterium]|nr:response regulator transcription factor [Bacteroidota bacterium]
MNDGRPRILLVEDEKKVSAFIKKGLEEENYCVETAPDGEKGKVMMQASSFDLVIMDILMPKKDGLTVLQEIRSEGDATPVLMITAKGSVEDKVKGLDTGADDYLVKPFAIAELLARVRSLLRRKTSEKATTLTIADLTLDLVSHKARRGARQIDLTAKEYMLLEYFIRNKNTILTRTTISEHIWNYNFDTGTNIIDVYINHLRAKIDAGGENRLLHTIRGVGYIMKEA